MRSIREYLDRERQRIANVYQIAEHISCIEVQVAEEPQQLLVQINSPLVNIPKQEVDEESDNKILIIAIIAAVVVLLVVLIVAVTCVKKRYHSFCTSIQFHLYHPEN